MEEQLPAEPPLSRVGDLLGRESLRQAVAHLVVHQVGALELLRDLLYQVLLKKIEPVSFRVFDPETRMFLCPPD